MIENRPGGGTAIGAQAAARSAPDGYTLLFVSDQTLTTLPMLHKNLPFDPQRDFVPVIALSYMDFVLVANPSLGVDKLEELVALAKAKPGSLNYGSFGVGSPAHLGMELFKQVADLSITHVPSKGVAQVVTDLLGGSVQIAHSRHIGRAADQGRQGQCAGAGQFQAFVAAAGCADVRREGLPADVCQGVVGHCRPGRHARRTSSTS